MNKEITKENAQVYLYSDSELLMQVTKDFSSNESGFSGKVNLIDYFLMNIDKYLDEDGVVRSDITKQ